MREWLNEVVQICVTDMTFEQKKELIQKKQEEFDQFDENTQNMIREVFQIGFGARDSVYILSVFLACVSPFMWEEELVTCVLREENYTYAESIMMEYQLKNLQLGSYAQRKLLRKKTVSKLKQLGIGNGAYIPIERRNANRIVIITEQISNDKHSPTLYVFNSIYYLRQLGYEIMVFSCPSDFYLAEDIWYRYRSVVSVEEYHGKTVTDTFRGEQVLFQQINLCGQDCIDRYRIMIDFIRDWNPLFVYEIGLVNGIGDLLTGMTTVVSEMLSIKDCSVSNAQILVRMEENEKEVEDQINSTMGSYQAQLWIGEDMPIFIDKDPVEVTRNQLHLPEDKFLIAVVGNRLDQECGLEFVELLRNILQNIPAVGVVIVGDTRDLNVHFTEYENIYFIGHQEHLQNIYDVMDLYLNPERVGGGYSCQMALQEGLPIVTLPGGDVAYMAEKDFTVADYEEMYAVVQRYVQDEVFRSRQRECARQRGIANSTDTDYMERKLNAIKEVMRLQANGEKCIRYTMGEA